ncbi:MAG: Hsp20/alpha crystallin family protein [Candidatus Doudnabacteria bacterium]|nr:Hsp20/alpha crystallin family protein [Candidatus Doudnabacteria bacterium]
MMLLQQRIKGIFMAKRTSFFGKIMGGSVTEDAMPVAVSQVPEEAEPEAEELISEETELEDRAEMSEVPASEGVQKSKEGEDWMSDYEGQLNIDMYQTKDNVIIKSTIAGVRPEDIDITVANDMVTIKGSRKKEETVSGDDYFYQECYWGNFSRSVIVPVDIDSENIEADLKDGILTVVVPKAAKAKTKKVKVKGL